MSLPDSAASGNRLAALNDLRDLLARNIESCDSLRDLASLSGRMQAVLKEIDELSPKEAAGDSIDEIAARRAARRAGAPKGAGRTKQSG